MKSTDVPTARAVIEGLQGLLRMRGASDYAREALENAIAALSAETQRADEAERLCVALDDRDKWIRDRTGKMSAPEIPADWRERVAAYRARVKP